MLANKKINIGKSRHISYIVVEQGADEADNHIVELANEGDLVITADMPLADRLIAKKLMRLIIEESFIALKI